MARDANRPRHSRSSLLKHQVELADPPQSPTNSGSTQTQEEVFYPVIQPIHHTDSDFRASTFLNPPLAPEGGTQAEPMTADLCDFDLTVADARVEIQKRDERYGMRVTFPEVNYWVELKERAEGGMYTIRAGQDRPKGNRGDPTQPIEWETHTFGEISDKDEWLRQVKQDPEDWLNSFAQIMVLLRMCCLHHDQAVRDRQKEQLALISPTDFAHVQTQLQDALKEAHKYKTLLEKSAGASIEELEVNVNELENRVAEGENENQQLRKHVAGYDKLKQQLGTASVQVHELEARLETSKSALEATKRKLAFEKEEADKFHGKYSMEYDKATQYLHDREQAQSDLEALQIKYQKLVDDTHGEKQRLISKIQALEPSFSPHTLLRRNGENTRASRGSSPREERRHTSPLRGSLSPARTECNGRSEYRIKRDRCESTVYQAEGRDGRPSEPYLPPNLPRASPAPTGMSAGSARIRLPDIDRFFGKEGEDFDKWRQMAINKCTLAYEDEHQRLAYIINFIKGEAWELVKDIRAVNFMEYIERLEEFYGNSSSDKISEALSKLTDPSQPLKQKPGESFSAWRVRFMAVRNLVQLTDMTMIKYAQGLMHASLANAASLKKQPGDSIAKYLQYAHVYDRDRQVTRPALSRTAVATPRSKQVTFAASNQPPY